MIPSQASLRLFERDLLASCGFGLQLEHEAGKSAAIDRTARYHYDPELGPRRLDGNDGSDQRGVSGEALLALKSGTVEDRHLKELKTLMRSLIRTHLGGRPLASHSLFSRGGD